MKAFFLMLFLELVYTTSTAQITTTLEPDFKYQIMYVQKDSTLSGLDKTGLSRVQKDKLMPKLITSVRGVRVYIKAEGCCAAVSVSGKPIERFIVKVDIDIDPSDIIQLYRFEQKANERILLASKTNIETKLNDNTSQLSEIPLRFKRIEKGLYLISHDMQLAEGEYVFITSMGGMSTTGAMQKGEYEKGYCFSVVL